MKHYIIMPENIRATITMKDCFGDTYPFIPTIAKAKKYLERLCKLHPECKGQTINLYESNSGIWGDLELVFSKVI